MAKTKITKKEQNPLYLIAGIALASLIPVIYEYALVITQSICPKTYDKCSFSFSLGGYYLAVGICIILGAASLGLIAYGIVNLVVNKKSARK